VEPADLARPATDPSGYPATAIRGRADAIAAGPRDASGMALEEVELLRTQWRTALDAADSAVKAATAMLHPPDLRGRGDRLRAEREATAPLLNRLAVDRRGLAFFPPLLPPDEARRRLRMPREIRACVFGLDGVLVASAPMHAWAWTKTLNELLERRGMWTHWEVLPFDPQGDYWTYIHGKPRLDGIRDFLASRGISLPLGAPADAAGAETVHGIANRKVEVLRQLLEEQGPHAYAHSHAFLELVRDARLRTAVQSSSAHTREMLERAGLAMLIDVLVDASVIAAERLRPRPAPDRILAACRLLGVDPAETAVLDTSAAGVAAARAAGARLVVAVERHPQHADVLRAEGADIVVTELSELYAAAAPSAAAGTSSSSIAAPRGVRRTPVGSRRSSRRQPAPERRQTPAAAGQRAFGAQPRSGPPSAGPRTEPRLQDIEPSAK
jgi:HAD superfamily hydrolase (TIGR01509 family)